MLPFRTLCLVATMLASRAYARDDSIGCYISGNLSPGFNAKLYDYKFDDKDNFSDPAYYGGKYSSSSLLGSADGIIDPAFDIKGPPTSYSSDVYGVKIHASNFAAELTGYFTPSESGMYTFSLDSIDDGAMVWLGDSAFDCCDPSEPIPDNSASNIMFVHKPYGEDSESVTASVYLQEGLYYPLKIVYTQLKTDAVLGFSILDPDGNAVSFGDSVWQPNADDIGDSCSSTTVFSTSTPFSSSVPSTTPVPSSSSVPSTSPVPSSSSYFPGSIIIFCS
ncbi:unnamed protein product [Ambrosiozyma monospora]|uniref:Unnamed protein product n=1 Tax=Ambrosiozyma monospora TaxID=43982 RepID=A0ACB5SUB5_AMBMO|nr:unnamed protein product [Ambrosiozyma monospora]